MAVNIAEKLRAEGFALWLSQWQQEKGESIDEEEMQKGVRESAALILLLTHACVPQGPRVGLAQGGAVRGRQRHPRHLLARPLLRLRRQVRGAERARAPARDVHGRRRAPRLQPYARAIVSATECLSWSTQPHHVRASVEQTGQVCAAGDRGAKARRGAGPRAAHRRLPQPDDPPAGLRQQHRCAGHGAAAAERGDTIVQKELRGKVRRRRCGLALLLAAAAACAGAACYLQFVRVCGWDRSCVPCGARGCPRGFAAAPTASLKTAARSPRDWVVVFTRTTALATHAISSGRGSYATAAAAARRAARRATATAPMRRSASAAPAA